MRMVYPGGVPGVCIRGGIRVAVPGIKEIIKIIINLVLNRAGLMLPR